jgi:Kelch motif
MSEKKLKLLCSGRKGVLLPDYPKDLEQLHKLISIYLKTNPNDFIISFRDQDGDECEVIDQQTYEAAVNEFSYKVVLKLINRQLLIPVTISNNIFQNKSKMKYFRKNSRTIIIFDLESETSEYIKLPKGILFKEYAAWIDLPSGEIFYCGGGHPVSSDETFIINPVLKTYKKLPNMHISRHSHGIVYLNGAVYVFGGIQNILFYGSVTKRCERYILEEEHWEEIPDLDMPRADVGITSKGDHIYLLGKGSQSIVEFNSNDISIDLGEDSGGSMLIDNNFIYAFHGSCVKVCDLNQRKVIERVVLPKNKSWWSHCPPMWYKDCIYLIWWEDPGWICKFNYKSKQFTKLLSMKKKLN